jgi:hypothetical protein
MVEALMLKRIIFGVVWAFALYLAICAGVGGIMGGLYSARYPDRSTMENTQEIAVLVTPYFKYFFVGGVVLSIIGSSFGLLPGTEIEKKPKKRQGGPRVPKMRVPRDVPEI